jgi:hypothetical protein
MDARVGGGTTKTSPLPQLEYLQAQQSMTWIFENFIEYRYRGIEYLYSEYFWSGAEY